MDVIVTLSEDPSLTITDVHPIALGDAVRLAIDAAVTLSQRLQPADDATP